ncbi:MAG TPA: hypothetical protein ENO00_11825 [Deltaproteobacteria bacterium]|nr:hypothetical protein [Deltaproteobacteria bacterium]
MMFAHHVTDEQNFNNNAGTVETIPAVREIVLDGDYVIVGIDVSFPLKEILHCLRNVIGQYVDQ